MEKSKNPIAVRSREMITQALWELLAMKPYSQITVTDITAQAGLGRKTFYRNYTEKDEIIRNYLDGLCGLFLDKFQSTPPSSYYEFGFIVFSFWEPYAEKMHFLHKKGLFPFFQKAFGIILPEVSAYFPCAIQPDTRLEYYCERYVSGGFFQILCSWLLTGTSESSETMARYFEQLRSGKI